MSEKHLDSEQAELQPERNGTSAQLKELIAINMKYLEHLEKGIKVKTVDTTASIGALGEMGFSVATLMNNLTHVQAFKSCSPVLASSFIFGGLAQFIAGLLLFKKGVFLGTSFFTTYGVFWTMSGFMSIAAAEGWTAKSSLYPKSLGYYLLMWCVITIMYTFASLKSQLTTKILLVLADFLYLFLSISKFDDENETFDKIGGWFGILVSLFGFYNTAAIVLENVYKRSILPTGKPDPEPPKKQ